jgi:asparagine synthase (glutamine-hydrolysing)
MKDALLDGGSRIFQYFRPQAVRELFEQHTAGKNDNHKVLFSLVVFEEWLRAHEEPVVAMA